MNYQPGSHYSVDQVLRGEKSAQSLSSAEKKMLEIARANYQSLEATLPDPLLADQNLAPWRLTLKNFVGTSSLWQAGLGLVVMGAVAVGTANLVTSSQSDKRETTSLPLNSATFAVSQSSAKTIPEALSFSAGSIIGIEATLKVPESVYVIVKGISPKGKASLPIFPQHAQPEKVLATPTWVMPFKYFTTSENEISGLLVVISPQIVDVATLAALEEQLRQERRSFAKQNDKTWIEVHLLGKVSGD